MNGNDLMGVTNFMLAAAHNSGAVERRADDEYAKKAERIGEILGMILEDPELLAEAFYEGYASAYTHAELGSALQLLSKGAVDEFTDKFDELLERCASRYAEYLANDEEEE